jgi:DNA-binding transcriptional LysR family regulator
MDRIAGLDAVLPRPRADVPALRAFVAVARLGTVARAAGALGRTQPSVSTRLARLERAWSTRLFRRVARGMTLTPEGARLLPMAEAALRELEELDWAAGLPVSHAAELRLGAGDALGRERLPAALAELLAEQPRLEVQLREGPGPKLLDALRAGEIDLALVVTRAGEPTGEGIDLEPLIDSEVRLLVPRGRPPSSRAVPLRSLGRERLVALQEGSAFRRHVELAFAASGVPFRPAVEVGNLSLVRRFVAAGLGVAPVPHLAFPNPSPAEGAELRRVGGLPPVRYARAVRSGVPLPSAMERLLELLRAPT